MPYGEKSRYKHIRRVSPRDVTDPIYTVDAPTAERMTKVDASIYPRGTKFRVGTSRKTGNLVVQSVLVPR